MKAFGLQAYLTQVLNQIMPTLCACKNLVNSYAKAFGSDAETTANDLAVCSEAAETASWIYMMSGFTYYFFNKFKKKNNLFLLILPF